MTSATNTVTWLASSNHRTSEMGSFQNNDILGVAITVIWIRISLIRIQILDRPREKNGKNTKKTQKKTHNAPKQWLIMKLLFMCVKPRCEIVSYRQKQKVIHRGAPLLKTKLSTCLHNQSYHRWNIMNINFFKIKIWEDNVRKRLRTRFS